MTSKKTTDNERFYEMAAVAPHKPQCNFGSFAPARSSVKPPLHKAATTLHASGGQLAGLFRRTLTRYNLTVLQKMTVLV